MNLAVVSNVNMEPMKNIKKKANIYVTPYGQYTFEIKNKESNLYTENFDVIWFHFDLDVEDEKFLALLENLMDDIENLISQKTNTLILFSKLTYPLYFSEKYLLNSEFKNFIDKLNLKLKKLQDKYRNFLIFNIEYIQKKVGYENYFVENFWYYARVKYSLKTFEEFFKEIENIYKAFKGKIKKVLILDLDNTLWRGVIGEDGLSGIKLSEDGIGKVYRDFQKNIKKLKNYGVLLCIVSKNNIEDVKEVFEKHPLMVLKWEDFIIKKINWKPKHENIKEIAKELNLGLDSFVFIDDNPFERNIIKKFLPEVEVPDFPEEIYKLNSWFFEKVVYKYFPKLKVTKEDIKKHEQYVRNLKRIKLKENLTSYEDFLKTLNIKLTFYKDDKRFISRLAQLTQKTNQFNLTTKRYTEKDIEEFIKSKNYIVYALEYEDIFGNEGIIGESIIKLNKDTAYIDTFLLSCRVIGRNVEYNFINKILEDLKKLGIKKVYAEYIPTKKNILVKDFYDKVGFQLLEENNGIKKYVKEI